jgi:hypothetical protein
LLAGADEQERCRRPAPSASLARGLPQLPVNIGIIAVPIGIVSGSQVWLTARRQPLARRSSVA